ncbi:MULTISPECIES: hypothetical protein [unclassified Roseateles]|uniref:hypothetical protein n=1 Tax=unclassified Roseateles TaxID=2626991 RepID=UPI0006F283EF|nr:MULTISPECIES: hypothetical protein [unclassified Roseateles]KQW45820.1 hypothetical protein ASC81_13130 [Pelomonas sp. Root405]KRA72665.1 hypothetical protein ASD88_13130 [Pelomonas sp. Root662]
MALSLPHPYSVIGSLHSALANEAKQVLHDAYVAAHASAAAQTPIALVPQEPDYVAELIKTGVPALAAAWKQHLAGHGLTIDILGVFVHQSPMVDFPDAAGTPKRCELGDLLLAVRFPSVPAPSGVASLTQAKMSPGTVSTLAGTDQHHLYSIWPDFDLARTSHAGIAIGPAADQGLLGEISSFGPTTAGLPAADTWTTEDFQSPGTTGNLQDILADLAAGVAGRPFSPFYGPRTPPTVGSPSAGAEWDFLIDYLLSVTFAKAFTRTRIGVSGQTRGIVVNAFSDGQVLRWEDDRLWSAALHQSTPVNAEHVLQLVRTALEFSLLGRTGGQLPLKDDEGPFEQGKGFGVILITIR